MSDQLIEAVKGAWVGALRANRFSGSAGKRRYVYASGIKSCTRAMALDLTHPGDREEFADEALARMERGKEREGSIVAWLMQIGPRCDPPFEVIEGQRRFEIKDRDGQVLIVGKVDCRLKFPDGSRPFVEVKSGEGVRRVESLDDFERSPWTRHMPDQLLAYLYAESCPWGMFVLDRPGLPRIVRVDLEENLARVERVLGQVRRAVDVAVDDAPLPPFIEDAAECRRCDHFKKSCLPPLSYGEGVKILTDPALIDAAETREKTRPAHEDYAAADKLLKDSLRGMEQALFGDFQAIGQWSPMTTFDVPKDVKDQYRVVKEQGRFLLKIERIA